MWFYAQYALLLLWRSVSGQWSISRHNLLHLSERNHEPCFVFLDAAICCMLDLIDPHGRHYELPFRYQNRILDIILLDQLVFFDHSLLPFILGYFFIAGRICINEVAQQSHINRVCMIPLYFFESIVILFFILDSFLNFRHFFFGTSLILLCLQVIVRDLSFNSNAFVWLETFHKAYS